MEKSWLRHYTKGVPEFINPDEYTSLVDFFDKKAARFSDNVAFANFGVTMTYRELHQACLTFAAYLQTQFGVKKGDRVALMMPNVLQYPIALFGSLMAGAVVVNVNPLYTAHEIEHQINDSGAKTIIVLENFVKELQTALPNTPLSHVVVTKMGDCLGTVKGRLANFVVKYVKKMVPHYQLPKMTWFKTIMSSDFVSQFEKPDVTPEDLAFLQYTGGTTGVAKGAMLTHRNMVSNVMQCITWVRELFEEGQEIVIGALPLYHIFSLTVCCMCFITIGSRCELITNPRDTKAFIQTLSKVKSTVFIGLNTLFNSIIRHPDAHQADFSNLKLTISGGMAATKAVAQQWHELTGKPITEGYGLTEASPVLTINPVNIEQFTGAIGLPISSTEVEIRDDDGNVLPAGEQGELWGRGPQVMQGYWHKPDETDNVLDKAGWLRTGDIACMDEDGYFRIVDRKKDMILVSGFNVYPNEIEDVLTSMPGIAEAAVIGVPCEKTGEAIKAFLVLDEGQKELAPEHIMQFCRQHLTPYKVPKRFEFSEDLPKSNVGKILRRELREKQLAEA